MGILALPVCEDKKQSLSLGMLRNQCLHQPWGSWAFSSPAMGCSGFPGFSLHRFQWQHRLVASAGSALNESGTRAAQTEGKRRRAALPRGVASPPARCCLGRAPEVCVPGPPQLPGNLAPKPMGWQAGPLRDGIKGPQRAQPLVL